MRTIAGMSVFDLVEEVSFEASDGSLGADRPALLSDKAGGVEIQIVGMLPVHSFAGFLVADIRAIRTDRREIAAPETADCRAVASGLLFGEVPGRAEIT